MISIQDLTFTYPHTSEPQLQKITFQAKPGEAIAIVGGIGAGKSTLLQIISGLSPRLTKGKCTGKISVNSINPDKSSLVERMQSVGLIFSDPLNQLSGVCDTVEEEIGWGLSNLGLRSQAIRERIDAIVEKLGLQNLRKRSPWNLSSGQQQMVAIASILVLSPRVILLDEVSTRLDCNSKNVLFKTIFEMSSWGTTVLWATTDISEISSFSRWIALDNGKIVYDGKPKILDNCNALEAPWTRIARQAKIQNKWHNALPISESEALSTLKNKR